MKVIAFRGTRAQLIACANWHIDECTRRQSSYENKDADRHLRIAEALYAEVRGNGTVEQVIAAGRRMK